MNEDYDYAHEKLFLAVESLATGISHLQQRLANAYLDHLITLEAEDLPEAARDSLQQVHQALTKVRDIEGTDGHVQVTADFMSDEKAREIARMIVAMADTVNDAYYGIDD